MMKKCNGVQFWFQGLDLAAAETSMKMFSLVWALYKTVLMGFSLQKNYVDISFNK